MSTQKRKDPANKIMAENRKARYNYLIESEIECGLMLIGSEVKSLRNGHTNIGESYANIERNELWLINSYFPTFEKAKTFGHDERRQRKLLVKKRELSKLWHNIGRDGMTLIPLKIYFNNEGKAKLLLGVAKGKKLADKRETEKKRDWQKQKARLMREKGKY
jgi:SsrA-binding protein